MTDIISRISAVAPMTGYGHTEIRKSLDAGKPDTKKLDLRFSKLLDEQRRKVSQVYESERETDETSQGRKVNLVLSGYYQEERRRLNVMA